MKNKIILVLCLLLAAVAALASCGEEESSCTHPASSAWVSNDTHHWHPAACEHGEYTTGKAEHTDADQDGICDVCANESAHTHTFADEWSYDESNHWKTSTCTHTDTVGEKAAHVDAERDAVCDVCAAHVHVINEFGFCTGCDKETVAVKENELGSVVYATFARKKFVTGGSIDYKFLGNNKTENTVNKMEHIVNFLYGTNGTYLKRDYADIDNAPMVQEDWIKNLGAGGVSGVTVITKNGTVIDAAPTSFDTESLLGYYYAIPTLADGYGAENVLKALYEASMESSVQNKKVNHDAANKKYTFEYELVDVHETKNGTGDEAEIVYNVHYYIVKVSFTYDSNYSLTSMNVSCDCYTNDPGADNSGTILEADVDLDYDPVTKTFALRATAAPDTYTYAITQNANGVRSEITLEDGAKYAPESFEVKYNGAAVENLELEVGDNVAIDIVGSPDGRFMAFIKNDIKIEVTKKDGTELKGFNAILHGYDSLNLYPRAAGEYVIKLTYKNVVKTVNVTVTGLPLGGEKFFTVESTNNNAWDYIYEFKAEKGGTYTFYLPYGVAATNFKSVDSDGYPVFTGADVIFDYDDDMDDKEGTFSFTKALREGQTYKICFKFAEKGVTYTIGYDEPK